MLSSQFHKLGVVRRVIAKPNVDVKQSSLFTCGHEEEIGLSLLILLAKPGLYNTLLSADSFWILGYEFRY